MNDTVRIDVERDFDLRYSAGSRRDTDEVEIAERAVLRRHLALSLQYVNRYRRLSVGRRRKDLALFRRDRRIARNELRKDAAHRFYTERKRRYVEEEHVFDVSAQNAALDRSAYRDRFIGVYRAVALFSENRFDDFLHFGHTARTADEQHFIDFIRRNARIAHRFFARLFRRIEQVRRHRFKLSARQRLLQVLGA